MIRLLRDHLRPYTIQIVVVLGLLLVQAIGNLYLPTLNGDIINNGVAKGDTDYILRIGGIMLGASLVLGITSIVGVYYGARVAMGFGRDVRSAIFRKVETFSQVEVNTFGAPSLITRNTNDVQQVQMVVFMALTLLVSAPILIIGGIIMAIRQDVPLSGLLVVVLPIMVAFIGIVMYRAIPLFRQMQVKLDRINQVMRETLAGVRVIRAFVRTEHEERRFDDANLDLFDTSIRVNRLFAVTIPVMTAILNLSTVAVMWFGGLRVDSGQMPIGNLTAFLQYLMQILFTVLMAVFMFVFVPRAAVSAARIREVLDTVPTIRDPDAPVPLEPHRPRSGGRVQFKAVEFRYPGAEAPILQDVSFEARPGEVVAIVGSTGAGKTTLINLVTGALTPDAGDVRFKGESITQLPAHDRVHAGVDGVDARLRVRLAEVDLGVDEPQRGGCVADDLFHVIGPYIRFPALALALP